MKKWILFLAVMLTLALCSGCGDGGIFAGGFASGATAMVKMSEDAQNKFIETVNELNEKTAEMESGVAAIEGLANVKPETVEAIEKVKDIDYSDPKVWLALASIFLGGRASTKVKVGTKDNV